MKNSGSRGDLRSTTQASPTQQALSAGVRGLARPVYRGPISHNIIAELAEAFRVLSGGKKKVSISRKEVFELTQNMGIHVSEEEFNDTMRVTAQGEQHSMDNFTFSEFLLLMTREVEDSMVDDMRSAFLHYDKQRTGFVTRKQFTDMFVTMGEQSSPEEVSELLQLAEENEDEDKIDYNKFINELKLRLNGM